MSVIFSVIGITLPFIAAISFVAALTGVNYGEASYQVFGIYAVFCGLLAAISIVLTNRKFLTLPTYQDGSAIGVRVVVYAWLITCLAAAVPLWWIERDSISPLEALFEAVSGITTTGATIFSNLDELDRSVLMYRQSMQWIGGLGLVVALVALMPALGQMASRLFRSEITGTQKDVRVEVRIQKTAMAFLLVYIVLTIACALSYWLAGMDSFHAIAYAFSTVSIGGFAPQDANIAAFNNVNIEWVAVLFMLLCSINFAAHYVAATQLPRGGLKRYLTDPELRYFLVFLCFGWVMVCALSVSENPLFASTYDEASTTIPWWRAIGFQTVSIITTTGFTNNTFAATGEALPLLWISLAAIGGCANTPTGGVRTMRIMAMIAAVIHHLRQVTNPHALFNVRLGVHASLSERMMLAIWAYIAAYIMVFGASLVILTISERDFTTAYGATMACLNNFGPGLGKVAEHYADINDFSKAFLSLLMLVGRLEIFAVLAFFTAAFHKSYKPNKRAVR